MILVIIFLVTPTLIYLTLSAFRLIKKLWLDPIRTQSLMLSQGINGPPYRFLHGNTKEIAEMRKDAMKKAMGGISHDIFPRILPHVYSWKKLYGANILTWLGSQAQLVITETELVNEILSNREGKYPKIVLEGLAKKLLGDGLSSSEGEKWARMRKLANMTFHGDNLRSMVPEMVKSVEAMLERWEEHAGKEIEVFNESRVLTSEIISRTAFGSSYLEGKNIFDMLMKLTLIVSRNAQRIRFPGISRFMATADEVESERLERGIRDCIVQIIEKRKMDGSFRSDLLGKLLEANRNCSDEVSVEDIVDECKTFYFAGHETTTSLLCWTILLISIHQEWQERAREEAIGLFGRTNPTADGIAKQRIMNMILQESLRLYPPVPAVKRRVEKGAKQGKLAIVPQMELYISPLAIHHDQEIWGEDAHLFRPERFAEGIANAGGGNPAAFLPFGLGPRACVGMNFAMVEAKVALSMILQQYRLILSPAYIHSPVQVFMIRPEFGVPVILL